MTADEFNNLYPVGTAVLYQPVKGAPERERTRTRSCAWTLSHGAVVVAVEGRAGGVLIDHLSMNRSDGDSHG